MKREKEGWRTEGKVGQKKEVRERNIDRLKEGRTNGCKEEIIEEKIQISAKNKCRDAKLNWNFEVLLQS